MRRLAVPAAVLAFAFAATPGVASADVIFDQADADELAATLAEATEAQRVCYGWSVDVDNEGIPESSVGSNFGAGTTVHDGGGCGSTVEFQASITWTPESSESSDSAVYSVVSSSPGGPTTADLDALEIISTEGLVGDDVDSDVYKAVAALPLLAADAGITNPIEASPAPEADSAGEAPTNSPTADFWRQAGTQILWGALLILGGAVFAWYVLRSSRGTAGPRTIGSRATPIPDHVPDEWHDPERRAGRAPKPTTAPTVTPTGEPASGEASATERVPTDKPPTPQPPTAAEPSTKPSTEPRPETRPKE